jgi:hypothetical protein
MIKKEFGLVFWLHLILIVFAYLSPFLFNFYIMIVLVLLYYLQIIIFNGCILTEKQFGKQDHMTFYYPYLIKLGFSVNKKFVYYLMRWIMPLIVLMVSLVLMLLNYMPLII